MKLERLVNDDKYNYFFGFHDLSSWNKSDDMHLALRVSNINHPPTYEDDAEYGYIKNSIFIKCGKTRAYNFPQGSRQQWLGDSNKFIINNYNQKLGIHSEIYDTENNTKEILNFPCHILDDNSKYAFYSDYNRLHHLGGYGYRFHSQENEIKSILKDGIFQGDISTNTSKLILSYHDFQEIINLTLNDESKQYFTHINLNKKSDKLIFLHRCFLNDGGISTRLCSLEIKNKKLKILAQGYLSHFTCLDEDKVLIYGRNNKSIDNIRNSKITNFKLIKFFLPTFKFLIKKLIPNKKLNLNDWLLITENSINKLEGFLNEDGHPMSSPVNSNLLINDTYPDLNFNRKLYLHNLKSKKNLQICKLKQIDPLKVNDCSNDLYFHGINLDILNLIGKSQYLHTRSGIHCDFHPRWNQSGTKVSFESNHQGKRNIYQVEV